MAKREIYNHLENLVSGVEGSSQSVIIFPSIRRIIFFDVSGSSEWFEKKTASND